MFKVLVLDDSALMRQRIRSFLEDEGLQVEDGLPATEADLLGRIEALQPDLLISDFTMPQLDGLAVARCVRRAHPKLPVIILTALRDPARDAQLKSAGVRLILHKPIHGPELLEAVVKVLSVA